MRKSSKEMEAKMVTAHGSVENAFESAMKEKMSIPEMGAEYGCSRHMIRDIANRYNVTFYSPSKEEIAAKQSATHKKRHQKDDNSLLGMSTQKARKEMTEVYLRGEALSHARLSAQVTTIRRGDAQFQEVVADIYRQRETCQQRSHCHDMP